MIHLSKTFVSGKPIHDRFFIVSSLFMVMLLLCVLARPVRVQAEPLDEATAIRLGLEHPVVEDLLNARVDQARGTLLDSGKWSNPEIEFGRESVDGLGGNGTENRFVVSQSVDFSGQPGLEWAAAQKHLDAKVFGTDAYRRQLITRIRNRFYEVLRSERLEHAVLDWMKQLRALEVIIDKRVAAGDASRYDSRKVAQERTTGPILLAEIRNERDTARERLAALIGSGQLDRYQGVTGRMLPAAPEPVEQVMARAQQRPDLRRLQEQVAAYNLERSAAERSAVPDVTVSMGVRNTRDDFNGDDNGLLLSASVPLPLFNRNKGAALRAHALAREAGAEYRIRLQRIEGDIRAAHQRLVNLRDTALQYRNIAVEPATELKDLAELAYDAGEVGILELIDACQTVYDTERQVLELEMKARLARIELDQLSGENLP